MKKIVISMLFVFALVASSATSYAGEGKTFALGLSSYAIAVNFNEGWIEREEKFGGSAVSLQGAFNDNLAIKGTYYTAKHDDTIVNGLSFGANDNLEMVGTEVQLLIGNNLKENGFKIYLGLGQFSEDLEENGTSGEGDSFSGALISLGLGYNWNNIGLDLWGSARDTEDYEKSFSSFADVTAASAGLGISARF